MKRGASDPHPEAPVRVLRLFRRIFNGVRTHFAALEKESGLGGAQIWALDVVRSRPGIGTTGLAEALDVRPSTASNLVRALVDRGLLDASRDAGDRRAVRLTVTAEGRRALRRTPSPLAGALPTALADLSDDELRSLEASLVRVLEGLAVPDVGERRPLADLGAPPATGTEG